MRLRLFLLATLVMWSVGVGVGLTRLWSYTSTPGTAADAPRAWPAASRLRRPADRPALVVLLHPQCPCSRATLAELARLLARAARTVHTYVLVLAPTDQSQAWVHSDLWRAAAEIPGVQVTADPDGREARRFGTATSGEVLLYNEGGVLQFAGGITDARGHEGDNAARDALEALIAGRSAPAASAVFGCALFSTERPVTPERSDR